jgi:hypothetical protein
MRKIKYLVLIPILLVFISLNISCENDDFDIKLKQVSNELVITNEVLIPSYIGNGVQWDPYPQAYRYWNLPIQDADWNKMYNRLDYMKPSFVRVVIGSYDKYAVGGADEYDPTALYEGLGKILQYCQDNNISVMLGDWGYNQVDPNQNEIFENRIDNAVNYLDFLVNTQGFTCIKYYNTINEPNLQDSASRGNYLLWRDMTAYFYDKMQEKGLQNQVQIAGPDIAIFNENDTNWITDSDFHFGDKIGLYDLHVYPSRGNMFNGEFERLLKVYTDLMPANKQAVIGEFGFKYETGDSNLDAELDNRNQNNINSDPFIGVDSNTLVEEYFHGVDLMALNIKIINSGFVGAINWNLDDAMHSSSTSGQDLKVWGYWNILGEELFGKPEKEELRPHFYAFSLLARYMQKGSTVLKVHTPKKIGLDAIAVYKDGKYMIAINNMHTENFELSLKLINGETLIGLKKFVYQEKNRMTDDNGYPLPMEENITLSSGSSLEINAQTFTVYTNCEF